MSLVLITDLAKNRRWRGKYDDNGTFPHDQRRSTNQLLAEIRELKHVR